MTTAPGYGLTISGAALLIGGAVLIALPPSLGGQRAPRTANRTRPSPPDLLRNLLAGGAGVPAMTHFSAGAPSL